MRIVIRMFLIHDLDHIDITGRFIGEALSFLADHDQPRIAALAHVEKRGHAGWLGRRSPPCLLHQINGSADAYSRLDGIAGVARARGSPLGGDGMFLIFQSHLQVMGKAASGKDDSLASVNGKRLAISFDLYSHDASILQDQILERRIQPERNVAFLEGESQAGNQGLPHHQGFSPGQTVRNQARSNSHGGEFSLPCPHDHAQPLIFSCSE